MAKIVFYLLLAPLYIIFLLPRKILYSISDFSAFFMRRIIGYRLDVVNINIARSFPDFKYDGVEKIAKEFYRNFTDVFVELLWSISATKKQHTSITEVENPEVLKILHEQGKSVMIILGHQANWENVVVTNFSSSGYCSENFRVVYKKMRNKSANLLIKWIREHHMEGKLVESNEIAKYMFKHKDEQLCYFLVSDQSPLPGAKFVVDFLNQSTLMMNGPEQLSGKLNLPVVFMNNQRVARGKYRSKLTVITEDPSKMEKGEITERFVSLLEAGINSEPSDWLWSHRRWKRSMHDVKNLNKKMMNRVLKICLLAVFVIITIQAESQTIKSEEKLPQGAIVYSLPSTTIRFVAEANHESFIAGPYARFAQKFLGIQAREESGEFYKLNSVEMMPYIEADNSSNIALNLGNSKNASANFLEFINQGLIIWSDSYAGKEEKMRFAKMMDKASFASSLSTSNLTNENSTLYKTVQTASGLERVAVQQSQVVEKSMEKRAEETAALIFKLRAKRIDIITGETDATFSGEALKSAIDEINRLESEYLSLFIGKSSFDTQQMSFDLVPTADNSKQIYIVFRIADNLGLLPSNNLSGRPIVLELSSEGKTADAPNMDISNKKGRVLYRKPATLTARVMDGQSLLLQTRIPIYQLGNVLSFPLEIATAK